MKRSHNVFCRVLTVGPSLKSHGGIQSVIKSYASFCPGFRHIASNSRFGTVAGAFNLGILLLRMPFERLRGRKILHVHSAAGKSFVRKTLIMRWGRVLGFRNVFHCHGAVTREYYAARGFASVRRALSSASAVVVLSDSWKDYFVNTLQCPVRVFVVNNPVFPVSDDWRRDGDACAAGLTLLFLGRLAKVKGLDYLLAAFAANSSRWRGRVRLIVGGTGAEADELKAYVQRNGLADMIEFIGWVDGQKKEAAFARSQVLILPSFNEGLPVAILEAMAHSMPVIATPVGGIPEVVVPGVNGMLIPPQNQDAIAGAVDYYLSNPAAVSAHGGESRRRAKAYFPDNVLMQLSEVYGGLLQ